MKILLILFYLVNTDHELHALEKRPKLNSSPGDCIASRTRSRKLFRQ